MGIFRVTAVLLLLLERASTLRHYGITDNWMIGGKRSDEKLWDLQRSVTVGLV